MHKKLIIYQRRSRAKGNFSVEGVIETLLPILSRRVDTQLRVAPFESSGIVSRIRIMIDAMRDPDVTIHITGDIQFAGLLRRRSTVIQTILDCGFMREPASIGRWIKELIWLRLPVRNAAAVICISQFTKNEIIRYLGHDPGNLHCIHIPLILPIKPIPLSFNSDCPTILQIGTTPNKNIPRLASAIKGIRCKLVILGAIDRESEKALSENEIRYETLSGLNQSQLIELYGKCDLVAFCSSYEGFGMPIIEAQALGRPVVTSNISPMAEIAGSGAEIVDPLNIHSIRTGILKVIEDSAHRDRMIEAGLKNCRRFDAEVIAAEYLEVYRSVMKKL